MEVNYLFHVPPTFWTSVTAPHRPSRHAVSAYDLQGKMFCFHVLLPRSASHWCLSVKGWAKSISCSPLPCCWWRWACCMAAGPSGSQHAVCLGHRDTKKHRNKEIRKLLWHSSIKYCTEMRMQMFAHWFSLVTSMQIYCTCLEPL